MIKIIITDSEDLIDPTNISWLGKKAAERFGVPDQPMLCVSNLKQHVNEALNTEVDIWFHKYDDRLRVCLQRTGKDLGGFTTTITELYKLMKGN